MATPRYFLSRAPRVIALLLLLVACASTPEERAPGYTELITMAEVARDAGQHDATLAAYERAAFADPARKEPWQRIARLHHERGHLALALAAAEQTLQRDPADAAANAIYIDAGLRVAADALRRMRLAGSPDAASKAQAVDIAAQLVDIYGADSVVPASLQRLYARRGEQRCRATAARAVTPAKPSIPAPRHDPLEMLGEDPRGD